MVLSAYHARSSVWVYGYPDQIWLGSGSKYCRLYALELTSN